VITLGVELMDWVVGLRRKAREEVRKMGVEED
jgi:hypothetical protein